MEMTPERWGRVKSLYDASQDQPQAERAAFLARATAGDDDLRREVQRLLDQPVGTADFVQFVGGPPGGDSTVGQHLAGRRFGNFEIKTLLGRGGMGEVYLKPRLIFSRMGNFSLSIKRIPRRVMMFGSSPLTENRSRSTRPMRAGVAEVSPDGRWLAHCSNESGQPQVYVKAFPGPKIQVSNDGGTDPVWRRDGQELLSATATG